VAIRQLPPEVAALIRAGEVVRGPDSVVKELVENALDAGAGQIRVALQDGGRRSIRVADNGHGMGPDAPMALLPHATSKIATRADLDKGILTRGFRGEALHAIAAACRVTIETRRAGDPVGLRVRSATDVEPASRVPGTTVLADALFHSIPARLKNLDSASAEAGRVLRVLWHQAISYPGVEFELEADGRTVLHCPKADTLVARIAQVHGDDFARSLVEFSGACDSVAVRGFVTPPGAATRRTVRRNTILVNGRPVTSPALLARIRGDLGMHPGEHPELILLIELPASEVDCNVDPAKSTVDFLRLESRVFRAVQSGIRQVLSSPQAVATLSPAGAQSQSPVPAAWTPPPAPSVGRYMPPAPIDLTPRADTTPQLSLGMETPQRGRQGIPRSPALLFQLDRMFICCPDEGGLWVVDQHSAHERVRYEMLRERFLSGGRPVSQPLLLPQVIKPSPGERLLIEEALPLLESLGWEIGAVGPRDMAIHAIPAELTEADNAGLIGSRLLALLETYEKGRAEGNRAGEAGRLTPIQDRMLMTAACHSAVRAGTPMDDASMRALWAQMLELDLAAHDVHGRPALLWIPSTDIASRLERGIPRR
jgi:DNA mismatch repair protein MutL